MTGKGISSTVNRAFMVLGSLFFFGGLYLGVLTFLTALEVYETEGQIVSLRVEKRRPMGFENIPVDSSDPDHADVPLYTDTYAVVEYSWNGVASSSEISSWSDEPGWSAGMSLPLYLVEGEEEYPLPYYPSEVAGEKKEALIIIIAMPLMGGILALVGFFSGRGEWKRDQDLLKKVRSMTRFQSPKMTFNRTLYEGVTKGNYFLGGIMTGIGGLLTVIIIFQFISADTWEDMLILPFPLLLGIGVLYIGLSEFVREEVKVTDRKVFLKKRTLLGQKSEERKITSFGGLKEQILEREVPGSLKRHIYREQVLLHEEPLFNGLSIALIPDSPQAEAEAQKLSEALNLPRILNDGNKVVLDYPEQETIREAAAVEEEISGPFPGKSLSLISDDESRFLVIRSYRKSLIWGSVLFAAGLTGAVLTSAYVLLIPTIVMSLIFDAIAFRRDELELKDGFLRVERFFLGKTYYSDSISFEAVDEILSGNDPRMNNTASLEILGDGRRIYFGQAASQEELNWLKQRLRQLIK